MLQLWWRLKRLLHWQENKHRLESAIGELQHWCNNAALWLNGQEELVGPLEAESLCEVTLSALVIVTPPGRALLHFLWAALFISVFLLKQKCSHFGKPSSASQGPVKSLFNFDHSMLLWAWPQCSFCATVIDSHVRLLLRPLSNEKK